MKKIKSLTSLLSLAIVTPIVCSCSCGQQPVSEYSVKFVDDQTVIKEVKVKPNTVLAKPEDPVKEGQVFIAWYEDPNFRFVYNFNNVVTSDLVLYAKFVSSAQVLEFHQDGNYFYTDRYYGASYSEYYLIGANLTRLSPTLTLSYVASKIPPETEDPKAPKFLHETKLYINREACAYNSFVEGSTVVTFKKNASSAVGDEIIVVVKTQTDFDCRFTLNI